MLTCTCNLGSGIFQKVMESHRILTGHCTNTDMGTRQILYSHVVLPYTEEYQGNLANVNKYRYMYTLCRFNLIIVRIACAVYVMLVNA